MIQIQIEAVMAAKYQQSGQSIKLSELAAATGISRMTLHRALNQKEHNLSINSIDKLCSYFGCDLTDLVKYVASDIACSQSTSASNEIKGA